MRYTTAFWLFARHIHAFLAAHPHDKLFQYCTGSDVLALLEDGQTVHPRIFQELFSRFTAYGYLQLIINHRVSLPRYIGPCRGLVYFDRRYTAYKISSPIRIRVFGSAPGPLIRMDKTPFAHRIAQTDEEPGSRVSGIRAFCWLFNLPLVLANVESTKRPRAYRYALAALLVSGIALELDSLSKSQWFETIREASRRALELMHYDLMLGKERFLSSLSDSRRRDYMRIVDDTTWLSTKDILSVLPPGTIGLPRLPELSHVPDIDLESGDDLFVTAITGPSAPAETIQLYLLHHEDHWIGAYLDVAAKTLYIADSLSDQIRPQYTDMILADFSCPADIAIADLSSHAQDDTSSCGVYAFMFLMTLPQTPRGLVQLWTRTNISLAREQMAILNTAPKRQNVQFTLDATLCWSYAQALKSS